MNFNDFIKLPVDSKLNIIYTELSIIKRILRNDFDDRSQDIIAEFPLRKVPLDICICGHGDQDHLTDMEGYNIEDGMCAKCVCRKFIPAIEEEKKI